MRVNKLGHMALYSIGFSMLLGACSREGTSPSQEENDYQALSSSRSMIALVIAPEFVTAGEKVDLFIDIYSKQKATVDIVAKIHSPDGATVHVAEFNQIELYSSSFKEVTDSFPTDSNTGEGIYSIELVITHAETSDILVMQESAARFTVTKAICTPSCKGRVCGDDGCNGSCGRCADNQSCNSGKCEKSATVPPSHSLNYDGVMHMPGESDPFKKCSKCHGYDLKSGKASSCYDCHNANDHRKGKVKHKSGSAFTCVTCHGPNNSGGLGQACSDCHR